MRRLLTSLLRSLRRLQLQRDESGAVMLFVGLGLFMLLGSAGIAIDMSRMQSANAKLGNALDAAGLAAGTKAHSGDLQSVVNNYVNANFPPGFMRTTITSVTATANADHTVINLTATAEVEMTVMRIFGQDSVTISASSEITRENRGLEMVMVLDVTGSMYGSKISDLRTAATDMVNILFGDKSTMENLWLGVVPYVTAVNVGADKRSWLRDDSYVRYTDAYSWLPKWKGCVEARNQWPENNGLDLTDDVPFTGDKSIATPEQLATTFPIYFWESEVDNEWVNPRNGRLDVYEHAGYSNTGGKGPNIGCGNAITPFTNVKATAQTAVDELTPWRRGGTMSSTGLAWAWRLISPKWRGMWGHGDPSLPLDYNTPLMTKAVIVMTDGVNEVYRENSLDGPGGSDYTSYGRIEEENLGRNVDTRNEGVTAVNNKFLAICNNMKAQGILIYTVTFQLNNSSASNNARTLFRNCATHPDYYFDSPDGATLRQSFRTIGDSLANLMISR